VRTFTWFAAVLFSALAFGQESDPAAPASGSEQPKPGRLLWLIPNSRTSPAMKDFRPLTRGQKFAIARHDSLDPGGFLLAGIFAAKGQAANTHPSFGQGASGFAKRFGTSYADWAINYHLTEAVFPSLLHQDPRYFRKGEGRRWSRFAYAMSQTFVTHSDSGRRVFNWSEVCGDATAVAISQAYYPDSRTAGSAAGKLGVYLGLATVSNVVKEFWPDIQRRISRKK
jgi:hypothetical protein